MRILRTASALLLLSSLQAQTSDQTRHLDTAIESQQRSEQDYTAAKRAAEFAAKDFYDKAQRFVELWEKMATELNTKKTMNYKLAKQVSKAFHELESCDGWPTREK